MDRNTILTTLQDEFPNRRFMMVEAKDKDTLFLVLGPESNHIYSSFLFDEKQNLFHSFRIDMAGFFETRNLMNVIYDIMMGVRK